MEEMKIEEQDNYTKQEPELQEAGEGGSHDYTPMIIDTDNEIEDSEVTPVNNPKRKKSCCPFCSSLVSNFTRHITTFHKSEEEVQEYLHIADEVLARKKRQTEIINILRNRGICLYNSRIVEGTEETELPLSDTEAADNRGYVVCKLCLGTFKKHTLQKHLKACPANINKCDLLNRPDLSEASAALKEKVFKHMSNDDVSLAAQSDPLILSLGSQTYTELEGRKEIFRVKSVSNQMREMAKILILLKEKNQNINSFEDCLTPACFQDLMDYVKQCSEWRDDTGDLMIPTLPIRVRQSVETCANILKTKIASNTALLTPYKQLKLQMIDEFVNLFETKWTFSLESLVGNNSRKRKAPLDPDNGNVSDSDEMRADPVDIAVASYFIMWKYNSAIKELEESPTIEKYKILVKYCIAHMMIVNGRHPEEVTHALLTHYQLRRLDEFPEKLRSLLISEEELKQVGSLELFYVPGKTLKVVPCLLTKNMKKAVDTLLKSRKILKIVSKYLFPRPTGFGNCLLFSGTQVINELVSTLKDSLRNPKSFTALGVLNYVQTTSQMIDVGLVHRTYFSTFLDEEPSETNKTKGSQKKNNTISLSNRTNLKLLTVQSKNCDDMENTSPPRKKEKY